MQESTMRPRGCSTCSHRPSGAWRPRSTWATQASVVIVEAAGHSIGPDDTGHLREVGALAAEQLAHLPGGLVEVVDELDAGLVDRAAGVYRLSSFARSFRPGNRRTGRGGRVACPIALLREARP